MSAGLQGTRPPLSQCHVSVLTSVVTVLVETDEHVVNLQVFFRKFQQKSKAKARETGGGVSMLGGVLLISCCLLTDLSLLPSGKLPGGIST